MRSVSRKRKLAQEEWQKSDVMLFRWPLLKRKKNSGCPENSAGHSMELLGDSAGQSTEFLRDSVVLS